MSWPIPPAAATAQWNPGMAAAMVPDASMQNMGSYTPEQWSAMQQQNWQQWAQWQQQYVQWQTQYGDKYAQQMQSMQMMGGMPPLPPANAAAPPPAPPPPDQPPPPPPHENNQPLFGQAQPTPAPVPAPSTQNRNVPTAAYNNANFATGNNQNWSYGTEARPEATATQPSVINAEALKKLAEEERLFDIQFQKWEEEIDKWRRENVNHPDKQAYKEYEQKFEACRLQLLERRNQMQIKKAQLMNTAPSQVTNAPKTGNNNIPNVVPPVQQTNNASYNQNMAPQNYQNKPPPQNYQNKPIQNNQNNPPQNYQNMPTQNSQNKPPQNYQNMPTQNSQNKPPQNYQNMPTQNSQNKPPQNYQNMPTQNSQNNPTQNYQNMPTQNYSSQNNSLLNNSHQNSLNQINSQQKNAHQNNSQYQQYNEPPHSGFGRSNNKNVDPQDRFEAYQTMDDYSSAPPDKSSFLPTSGNAKSIPGLDLVPETDRPAVGNTEVIDITEEHGLAAQRAPDYSKISKGINNILGDEKIMNILSMVRGQGTPDSGNQASNPPGGGQYVADRNNSQPNNQWGNDNIPNNQQYGNNRNMDYDRQGPNYPMQQNPPPQKGMYGRQGDMPEHNNYDRNNQYGNQNTSPQSGPPNMRPNMPPRPLMEIVPGQNINDYSRGNDNRGIHEQNPPNMNQPIRHKWVDDPLFTPSIIVEYEHKALRLKARDFIEPVHMFDYNHISKEDEYKKKNFESEVDDLFARKPRRLDKDDDRLGADRFARDIYSRDYERRVPREEIRDDYRPRVPPKDEYDERRRPDMRYDERRRDDRDKYIKRDDSYRERDVNRDRDVNRERDINRDRDVNRERDINRDRDVNRDRDRDMHRDRERDRDFNRDRFRDLRREDNKTHSLSREREIRKRGRSKESDRSDSSKKTKDTDAKSETPKHVVMIDDILESPGRDMRPEKIVIILRGPPGSGKSYLAKLIRDREAEYRGTARIMSIDDYFMQEGEVEEKDPVTGKIINKPSLKYEYDENLEETYLNSLRRAFKRSLTDGYFSFLIYDAVNDQLKSYADVWNFARQNGFQVYICTMELDANICYKRNIHNRTKEDIEVICSRFFPTPAHHIQLDATTLLQSAAIPDVQMDDVSDDVIMEDVQEPEVESIFTSKWEKMDDATKLARLDGTSKPLRSSQLSMEDYLQLDDWTPNKAKPGKKSVRWADIEERRQQEKMRAIGFVVGQTDWNRMTDPTMGSSALTQTKYIERVRRN